jgi:hypothetical protein
VQVVCCLLIEVVSCSVNAVAVAIIAATTTARTDCSTVTSAMQSYVAKLKFILSLFSS